MDFARINKVLVLSFALISLQFGTSGRCFATDSGKTVELADDPSVDLPESGKFPNALLALKSENEIFSKYAFLVDKKSRTLTVWENDGEKIKAVAAFPVDLGAKPGDKMTAGDLKTPEGIYFFQEEKDGKKVDYEKYGERIFTTDYPNLFDRLERKTGHGIWLHAIPDSKPLNRGSHGCVVMRNKAIESLEKYVELKSTPMIVVDQVVYLSEHEWLESRKKIRQMFVEWNTKRLANLGIEGVPSNLQIFNQGRKLILRFAESEKSELKDEVGVKTLYAFRRDDGLEIISERWQPLANGSGDTESL